MDILEGFNTAPQKSLPHLESQLMLSVYLSHEHGQGRHIWYDRQDLGLT